MTHHQYIERKTLEIKTEKLFSDRAVRYLYSALRENSPRLFKLATSSRMSGLLGFINYDFPFGANLSGAKKFCSKLGIDPHECLDAGESLCSSRSIFERKIRYWEARPMDDSPEVIASPADSRMLAGSFGEGSLLFLKEKFFSYEELIGKAEWTCAFRQGDFAIFRLTPEKYHWNHVPVSGVVADFYEIDGAYHSCNPGAVITAVTPFSKNKRVVTIINTDVEGGSHCGLVAMLEIVALMIGNVVQRYSEREYENPRIIENGMFVRKGRPKSLYRPGSSVDVLIFQNSRVEFSKDIVENMKCSKAQSRYTIGFGSPLVETDVKVRSEIGRVKK